MIKNIHEVINQKSPLVRIRAANYIKIILELYSDFDIEP